VYLLTGCQLAWVAAAAAVLADLRVDARPAPRENVHWGTPSQGHFCAVNMCSSRARRLMRSASLTRFFLCASKP
jgi:hypothetical protein